MGIGGFAWLSSRQWVVRPVDSERSVDHGPGTFAVQVPVDILGRQLVEPKYLQIPARGAESKHCPVSKCFARGCLQEVEDIPAAVPIHALVLLWTPICKLAICGTMGVNAEYP